MEAGCGVSGRVSIRGDNLAGEGVRPTGGDSSLDREATGKEDALENRSGLDDGDFFARVRVDATGGENPLGAETASDDAGPDGICELGPHSLGIESEAIGVASTGAGARAPVPFAPSLLGPDGVELVSTRFSPLILFFLPRYRRYQYDLTYIVRFAIQPVAKFGARAPRRR